MPEHPASQARPRPPRGAASPIRQRVGGKRAVQAAVEGFHEGVLREGSRKKFFHGGERERPGSPPAHFHAPARPGRGDGSSASGDRASALRARRPHRGVSRRRGLEDGPTQASNQKSKPEKPRP